jgi:hypothetical protein
LGAVEHNSVSGMGSLHRFIISLAPTGVHFNEMHFVSFHFSERQ